MGWIRGVPPHRDTPILTVIARVADLKVDTRTDLVLLPAAP